MNIFSYFVYLPEIGVVITTLYILLRMLFLSKDKKNEEVTASYKTTSAVYLGLCGLVVSLLIAFQFLNLWITSEGFGIPKGLISDGFTLFLRLPILFSGLIVILFSADFFKGNKYQNEYYILLFLSLFGTLFVLSANDLISIYIALELCSIPTYILTSLERNEPKSIEGATKYFLLGLLGSVTMLYGFSFLYGFTGTTYLSEMAKKLFFPEQPFILLAMSLVIFGLGIKIAAVPFHFRLPDAYEGAPTPVTAYLSVGPKIAGFAVILRIFLTIFTSLKSQWMIIFTLLSVASMTVGNLLALMQDNVKRMFAYSSIAHTGYLLVGLAVADQPALSSMLFYLFVYIFANLGVFAIVSANSKYGELIESFTGLNQRAPFYALTMTLFLLSLAGIPPLAGFMGKLYLFATAVRSGYTWLAVAGVLNSVFSLSYYFRIVRAMYTIPSELTSSLAEEKGSYPFLLIIALIIVLSGIIILGLYPSPVVNLAQRAITF